MFHNLNYRFHTMHFLHTQHQEHRRCINLENLEERHKQKSTEKLFHIAHHSFVPGPENLGTILQPPIKSIALKMCGINIGPSQKKKWGICPSRVNHYKDRDKVIHLYIIIYCTTNKHYNVYCKNCTRI
jgi:hypothetical protein